MLTVTDVSTGYGESQVLFNVSLKVRSNQIVSIVGSNAAGKSTLIDTINGTLKVWSGTIEFDGEDITGLAPQDRVARRLINTPEGRRLFPELTVKENLLIGAYHKAARPRISENLAEVYEIFPVLRERGEQTAGSLSGGEQQMCAIARSLMSCPRLLILDEPSLGLAPILVEKMFETLRRIIAERDVTVLLVEQNVQQALAMSDYGYVLESGEITMSGESDKLLRDPGLRKAYLGL
jgi:branched-chain amino acid transport system ATP-binding protein